MRTLCWVVLTPHGEYVVTTDGQPPSCLPKGQAEGMVGFLLCHVGCANWDPATQSPLSLRLTLSSPLIHVKQIFSVSPWKGAKLSALNTCVSWVPWLVLRVKQFVVEK